MCPGLFREIVASKISALLILFARRTIFRFRFHAVDRGLHCGISRPVLRGKGFLNLANGAQAVGPKRLHDLQLQFGEFRRRAFIFSYYVMRVYYRDMLCQETFCDGRCGLQATPSVRRGLLLDMVNDEDGDWPFLRFQPQAELFLECSGVEDGRKSQAEARSRARASGTLSGTC